MKLGALIAVAAGLLAFFIYLTSRITTPEMALLYGQLEAEDSGEIIKRLDELKVPYEISPDGAKIMVSSDQVARMRVIMAQEGLPNGGSIGYEIFDRSDGIGTTNFVQNINHVRALEGELSRTIRSIGGVKNARVHLVLPQRQIFSRERQDPSASIVLNLVGARALDKQQVLAIQHLISAAVPGLKPQMVSIVDSHGNLLARPADENSTQELASNADDMRVSYETRTARVIEEMLARSLGPGNVRVQVAAELDFDRVTENSETYDPDGQVVRSTQTVEENSDSQDTQAPPVTVGANLPNAGQNDTDAAGAQSSTSRTEETVNYEISRVTKTHVKESGLVRRLSVAVMVNGTTSLDAEGNSVYQPRSDEELASIATLVRSAAGLDEERGDRLEVADMPFVEITEDLGGPTDLFFGFDQQDLVRLAEIIVLALLGIMVLLFVVRPTVARLLESEVADFERISGGTQTLPDGTVVKTALAGPGGALAPYDGDDREGGHGRQLAMPSEGNLADEISNAIDLNHVEGRVRESSVRKIGEIIQKHPEEAANIVRAWLYQQD